MMHELRAHFPAWQTLPRHGKKEHLGVRGHHQVPILMGDGYRVVLRDICHLVAEESL